MKGVLLLTEKADDGRLGPRQSQRRVLLEGTTTPTKDSRFPRVELAAEKLLNKMGGFRPLVTMVTGSGFVALADMVEDPTVIKIIEQLNSASFRAQIRALGGYDTTHTGEIHEIGF